MAAGASSINLVPIVLTISDEIKLLINITEEIHYCQSSPRGRRGTCEGGALDRTKVGPILIRH